MSLRKLGKLGVRATHANQPASSIRCGSRAAHLHQEPSLPRFRSGGTCRQTTSPENRPVGSQHARCEPSLVSQLEAVADSGNSWWAVMSSCYIYWCSAHWPECSDSVLRMRATRPEICAEQPILRCLDEKCGPADDVGKKLVATRPVSPVAPPSSTLKSLKTCSGSFCSTGRHPAAKCFAKRRSEPGKRNFPAKATRSQLW